MLDALLQKALDGGHVSSRQAIKIQSENQIQGTPISTILLRKSYLSEQEILTYLSRTHRLEFATFNDIANIKTEIIDRFASELLSEWKMLPLAYENRKLPVAVETEPPAALMDKLSIALGCFIYPKITTRLHLDYGLFYHLNSSLDKESQDFIERCQPTSTTARDALPHEENKRSDYQSAFLEVLQALGANWQNVLLFKRQKGDLISWSLNGDGTRLEQGNVRKASLYDDVVFSKVFVEGYPYVGDVKGCAVVFECLKSRPRCGYLLPLIIFGKIVGALYVDNGSVNASSNSISDLHLQKKKLMSRLEQQFNKKSVQIVQNVVVTR